MSESIPVIGAAHVLGYSSGLPAFEVSVRRGGRADLAALLPEWRALCAEGPCTAPYFQPAWVLAYLDAFAPEARLVVLTARASGQLRAILPLVERRVGVGPLALRWLHSASNPHSVRFDLIHGAGDAEAATMAIWNFLTAWRGWDVVHIRAATKAGPTFSMLAAAADAGFPIATRGHGEFCTLPVPAPGATFESILARQSRRRRKHLRGALRRLSADGDVQLRFVAAGDRALPAALADFYALEAGGWKGRAGTAIAREANTRKFYDALARAGEGEGMLSLYLLEHNGKLIAAKLGVRDGPRFISLKTAYDERYRLASPGHVLTLLVLADGASRGFSILDIGGSTAESGDYKQAWASDFEPFATGLIFRKNAKGRLAHRFIVEIVPRSQRIRPIAAVIRRVIR